MRRRSAGWAAWNHCQRTWGTSEVKCRQATEDAEPRQEARARTIEARSRTARPRLQFFTARANRLHSRSPSSDQPAAVGYREKAAGMEATPCKAASNRRRSTSRMG